MNFETFRRTGELSDITVIVDKTEFKLHTFPLFTKSDYFKKAIASSKNTAPHVVRLDNNFPGGAKVFDQLADYFYSIPISIDHTNIVALRSAAGFIGCETLATLLDKRFDEILLVARAKRDLGIPLVLLEQCIGEHQHWAKEAHIVSKCLESIVDWLGRGASPQLNKIDREILIRLPVEWIVDLIQLCPRENKLLILPIAKHYISMRVLDHHQHSSSSSSPASPQNGFDHQSAFTPVNKKDEIPITSDDEKRTILDVIIKALGNAVEEMPLVWLNATHEKAIELKCECESTLSQCITQAILNATDLSDGIDHIPDDVMARLLEQVSKHKDEHIKDPHTLAKLSALIDSYVEQLRQRGTLTSEQFVKLASCIPKEQRGSHDSLLLALDDILKNEKSTQLSSDERQELLAQIDFSRVNEETIATCKSNELIPQQLITEAALALCVKLRSQLDETQTRLRQSEIELGKYRPTLSSSSHRPRTYESHRLHTRSRPTYSHTYELPSSISSYTYSKYDNDTDFDHVLPSRYSSSSIGRFGSYSTYRY